MTVFLLLLLLLTGLLLLRVGTLQELAVLVVFVGVELHLDIDGVADPVQDLGGQVVVGSPQIDAGDLQQLVSNLQSGLVSQAVLRHRGDKDAASTRAGAAWGSTVNLLDLDTQLLTGLLNVDCSDLSWEGGVVSPVGSVGLGSAGGGGGGRFSTARRQNFYVV